MRFGSGARLILTRITGNEDAQRLPFLPYTGARVPGDKIAVDTDGTLHLCEKINQTFPIGNVDQGLDFEAITKIVLKYNEQITPMCANCVVSKLCSICYVVVAGEGKFERQPPNICQSIHDSIKQRLACTYSILEENPKAYDEMITNYYDQLAETCQIDF